MSLPCLFMLKSSGNMIQFTVLDQPGSGLMIRKADAIFPALPVKIQHPPVIAGAGVRAGFTADRNGFNGPWIFPEVRDKVYGRKHGFRHDRFVTKRQRQVYRETELSGLLVLAGDSDSHLIPDLSPIRREVILNPFRSFGDHEEGRVRPFPYHIPGYRSPFIGIRMEKVR